MRNARWAAVMCRRFIDGGLAGVRVCGSVRRRGAARRWWGRDAGVGTCISCGIRWTTHRAGSATTACSSGVGSTRTLGASTVLPAAAPALRASKSTNMTERRLSAKSPETRRWTLLPLRLTSAVFECGPTHHPGATTSATTTNSPNPTHAKPLANRRCLCVWQQRRSGGIKKKSRPSRLSGVSLRKGRVLPNRLMLVEADAPVCDPHHICRPLGDRPVSSAGGDAETAVGIDGSLPQSTSSFPRYGKAAAPRFGLVTCGDEGRLVQSHRRFRGLRHRWRVIGVTSNFPAECVDRGLWNA
jgi:hypothetical protein